MTSIGPLGSPAGFMRLSHGSPHCSHTGDPLFESEGCLCLSGQVNDEFLEYTKQQGNDLSTPRPPYFPGLHSDVRSCVLLMSVFASD